MTDQVRKIEITSEIRVKAPRERVWQAITDEQMEWYPYSYGGERLKRIVCEHRVGGHMYEDWGDGAGFLYNTIKHWDPPAALSTLGSLGGGVVLEQSMTLEEEGDETVLRSTTITFGEISDEAAEGIRSHGTLSIFEDKLRAWVERGESVRTA